MNKLSLLAFSALFNFATAASAQTPDSYQVTGPILELSDTKIVVLKDKENWELARNPETKVTGELKVGAKVTVKYFMTAKTIEVKDASPKK